MIQTVCVHVGIGVVTIPGGTQYTLLGTRMYPFLWKMWDSLVSYWVSDWQVGLTFCWPLSLQYFKKKNWKKKRESDGKLVMHFRCTPGNALTTTDKNSDSTKTLLWRSIFWTFYRDWQQQSRTPKSKAEIFVTVCFLNETNELEAYR